MRRTLLALGAACLLVAGGPGGGNRLGPRPAEAAPRHRAAVVVDTGAEVKRVCIRFDAEEITGREALELAGVDPVFASYGGQGAAVCSLCGVGCPSADCFCEPDRYWAYHRAPAGSSSFTYSDRGVSSTLVRDGDVEGWRWGRGEAPPYADIRQVCGEATTSEPDEGAVPSTTRASTSAAPSSTAPAATEPTGSSSPSVPGSGGDDAGASEPETRPRSSGSSLPTEGGAIPPSEGDGDPATPASPGPRARASADGEETAAGDVGDEGAAGPGSAAGVVVVAVIVAGLLLWARRLRRT